MRVGSQAKIFLLLVQQLHREPQRRFWCAAPCLAVAGLLFGGTPAVAQDVSADEPPARGAPRESQRPAGTQAATLTGLITDTQGIPIIGATVTLTSAEGATPVRETTSDANGRFVLSGIPAGSSTLAVAFQGFDTASSAVTLQPGESLAMSPIPLKISTVKIDVNAVVPTREIAAEELHIQEKQRLLGFAPNFFVSYKWDAAPLTSGQKFSLAWKNVRDPGNLLLVGTVAGVQQAADDFNGYGQGAKGYGRRYGADLGNLVAGTFLGGAVLPSLFHQDPRYFYKGTGSFKSRLWYSLTSAVICRGDNGKRQFAWSGVLGDLSAGALSNAYYAPEDRHGAALTLENGFLGVAGDALNGLVQEFFFKQITPKARKHKPSPVAAQDGNTP